MGSPVAAVPRPEPGRLLRCKPGAPGENEQRMAIVKTPGISTPLNPRQQSPIHRPGFKEAVIPSLTFLVFFPRIDVAIAMIIYK